MSKPLARRWSFRLAALLTLGIVLVHLNYRWVDWTYQSRLHASVETTPANNVGLVLGTSPRLPNGRANPFFIARMDAAAELYHAGKVRKLITSGGSDGAYYDEALSMASALNKRGVPMDDIIRDNAGYRTLDSILRARESYGLEHFTIISQPFHNHRALYIARHHDIDAIAYNASQVGGWENVRAQIREHGARLLMMADLYLLDTQPETLAR